ncbi:hypothetical protein E8E13_009902 [Curvularia kusanoi]|uniref:Uncharacterized protein n=1 Tax=Curvularia kusanoi TaxID=90978 RepID=A0A9P4TER0_CURKU|nr:hypothetical protein E8E13_009902 [Curvularia kusanoi]
MPDMFHEFVDSNSFPKDSSAEYPHIVKTQTFVGSVQATASGDVPEGHTLKVWDAVATLLNTVSPAFCPDFFDLTKDGYRITAVEKNSTQSVLIWRRGSKVIVGTYGDEDHPDLLSSWVAIVRCTIATDGAWTIDSSSHGATSPTDWDTVWVGGFEDGFKDHTGKAKAARGFIIAEEILAQLPFDPKLWHWDVTPN